MRIFNLFIAIAAIGWAARAAADEPALRCQRIVFPVAQTPGGAASEQIVGQLCARGAIHQKTIQVLVHGATYDHNYWDFPYQPATYSYVRQMTAAGYATLNIDRVGYGESSHPAVGAGVTLHTGAYNLHQIVQVLRSGSLVVPFFGRVRAERVEVVGFSLGSFIALLESSTYQDVDGVVLSSYSHRVGQGGIESFSLVIPAPLDPKFPDYPFDYLSDVFGARPFLFFHLPNVDPDLIAIDYDLRDTWTLGELGDIIPSLMEPPAPHAPVLVIDGDWDTIACDTPCTANDWLAGETALYPADSCPELEIIPDAGHALALHRNAQTFFAAVRAWSDRRVGASTLAPATDPCPSPGP